MKPDYCKRRINLSQLAQPRHHQPVEALQGGPAQEAPVICEKNLIIEKRGNTMFEELVAILCDQLPLNPADISMDSKIKDDLGADSLDTVELLLEFEKVFDIKIPDEETSTIATVKDAIDKVNEKLQAK